MDVKSSSIGETEFKHLIERGWALVEPNRVVKKCIRFSVVIVRTYDDLTGDRVYTITFTPNNTIMGTLSCGNLERAEDLAEHISGVYGGIQELRSLLESRLTCLEEEVHAESWRISMGKAAHIHHTLYICIYIYFYFYVYTLVYSY